MPLHIAAWEDSMELAQPLLQCNADIEAINEDNLTPLYVAAKKNRTEFDALLFQHNEIQTNTFLPCYLQQQHRSC